MKLRTLLLGLMAMVGMAGMEAAIHQDVISLIGAAEAPTKGDAFHEADGFIHNWPQFQSMQGITITGTEWNPTTGQVRVDKPKRAYGSNFTISSINRYPGKITKIHMELTGGSLRAEEVELSTLSMDKQMKKDHVAKVGNGYVSWDIDKRDVVNAFQIQMVSTEPVNTSKVYVSKILIIYDDDTETSYGAPEVEDDDEVERPQPIEPEEPTDTLVSGGPEPIPEPEVNENEKANFWNWIGQLDPTQPVKPEEPDTQTGDNNDPNQPAPPGGIKICKKHLLEYLTEEELAPLYEAWGDQCGDAARDWMKQIPAIKKNTSAACQAALRGMTYDDYMQFCHGFLETLLLLAHDFSSLVNENYTTSDQEFLEMVLPDMIVIGPELARLYMARDPLLPLKMKNYVDENVPFVKVMVKYNLYGYVFD